MMLKKPDDNPIWQKLVRRTEIIESSEKHLKKLLAEPERLESFSLKGADIFYDYSRQRVDAEVMELLFELAKTSGSIDFFNAMADGETVNNTEKRAALHTATRSFSCDSILLNGVDAMPDIEHTRDGIRDISTKIREGKLRGSTGKPFKHIVVIGIGGSYLGTEFVSTALRAFADDRFQLHYLSNVDIHNFGEIASVIDPETTLWINISKSFTTAETMANAGQAVEFMTEQGLDPDKHFIIVTSKGSPGDDPDKHVLRTFHMFDLLVEDTV